MENWNISMTAGAIANSVCDTGLFLMVSESPRSISPWQKLFEHCLSYSSVVAVEHHDQGNLEKKECIWVYGCRRISACCVGKHGSQQQAGLQERETEGSQLQMQA